ncbi:MFS transporter [Maritalea mediterranea]|uniref:MFS transporter n=1 Tax=Maritalea mediterranea TaxID=2909667 RepID=A0ABS9E972_9HYPH|nr:MFS transporter [Maritalea mediterranea]MCF4098310.1 MFS transporter [Maritalea mediterranea]
MWIAIRAAWPLFVGMVFLMVSNGLLSSMLTIRGQDIGFSETTIGFIHSGYPFGFILSCFVTPLMINHSGHVRVFAALVSIASTSALIHLVTDDPWIWVAMRVLSGFCFSGIYIVAESWLNSLADNRIRGSLLSSYFVVQTAGYMVGQVMIGLSAPGDITLFIVTSVLLSVALVPILIAATTQPSLEEPQRVTLRELFHISPMAVIGGFFIGIANGGISFVTAIYAQQVGLSVVVTGYLLAATTLGGLLFQFPLGKLSDVIDRRLVIIVSSLINGIVCLGLVYVGTPHLYPVILFGGFLIMGGFTLPVYSICMAHMNDYLKPQQMVAASSTLVLVFSAGMVIGPIGGSFALDQFEGAGMFVFYAVVALVMAATGIQRIVTSDKSKVDDKDTFVPLAATTTPEATQLQLDDVPTTNERTVG